MLASLRASVWFLSGCYNYGSRGFQKNVADVWMKNLSNYQFSSEIEKESKEIELDAGIPHSEIDRKISPFSPCFPPLIFDFHIKKK